MSDFPETEVTLSLRADEGDVLYFVVRHEPGVKDTPPLRKPRPVLVRLPGSSQRPA